jgi:hypothetical protein
MKYHHRVAEMHGFGGMLDAAVKFCVALPVLLLLWVKALAVKSVCMPLGFCRSSSVAVGPGGPGVSWVANQVHRCHTP